MREWVWKNFVVSVWLLIGFCVFNAIDLFSRPEAIVAAYGPFGARVALWPVALGIIELMLWFKPFRHRGPGARLLAAFMGVMLLLRPVLVALIVSDLYDRPVDWLAWWIYAYVAISHLAFAVCGRPAAA